MGIKLLNNVSYNRRSQQTSEQLVVHHSNTYNKKLIVHKMACIMPRADHADPDGLPGNMGVHLGFLLR
jgi:hypothetical protein